MYSLVVLMALSTAGEAPDWGCRGGGRGYCGGWGGSYCGSYSYGGGWSGGYCGGSRSYSVGWGGGYCGSYSYCAPSYSVSYCRPAYTCSVPVSYTCAAPVSYTCAAPVSYSFATPVISCGRPMVGPSITPITPGTPSITPSRPKEDKKKAPEDVSAPATIIVNLPADAQLTFDGEQTKSTSARRIFVTPELKPGTEYSYVLKAQTLRDGQPVVLGEKKVTLHAGDTTEVTLSDTNSVVSR